MTTTATRHDRRMLRLMNDTRYQHLHATRARRRGLVAAHVVLTAGALASLLNLDRGWAAVAALAVLTLAWCTLTGALNMATRGLLELRARVLDERQLADRGRAFTLAHRIFLALQLAVLLCLFAVYGGGDGRVTPAALFGLVLALLSAHWLLPLWAAAFTAPDAPAEDD